MCRFEPSYLAVTICKDSESSAKGHRLPHDKKRLDSAYCNRGQKCKEESDTSRLVDVDDDSAAGAARAAAQYVAGCKL